MDRNDQRDHSVQTSSWVTTQSWYQRPNQSWQNRCWEQSQYLRDQTDHHVSWWLDSWVFLLWHIFSRCFHGSACARFGKHIDDVSKFIGASSKSRVVGQRVLALAAARHEKSSPLSVAEGRTQSDVKGQENPSPGSGDRLHFPHVQAQGERFNNPMTQARTTEAREVVDR